MKLSDVLITLFAVVFIGIGGITLICVLDLSMVPSLVLGSAVGGGIVILLDRR